MAEQESPVFRVPIRTGGRDVVLSSRDLEIRVQVRVAGPAADATLTRLLQMIDAELQAL